MPSIKKRMGPLEGFQAVQNPTAPLPAPRASIPGVLGANSYIRCPLPPLNVNTDTLRQFDESGDIPTRRVLPLPAQTVTGGNTTVITNVLGATAGGGGGVTPSGGGTSLVVASVTINIPALAPSSTYSTFTIMSKSFQLLQLFCSQPLEVRIYGTALAQGADISRSTDTAPPFETAQNILTSVVFDTAPYQWAFQNRCGANADAVPSTTIYVTVVNPSTLSGTPAATATIRYVPLEA